MEPTYHAVHNVLTHPAYAGAYVFGRTRQRRRVDADGALRVRRHRLPPGRMGGAHHRPPPRVHRLGHLPGQPDSDPAPTPARGRTSPAPARCARAARCCKGWPPAGLCGRKLAVYYDGPAKTTPGYYCTGTGQLVEGRGTRHLRVGGPAIDAAVTEAFLAALQPAALQACLAAAQQLEDGHDAALAQWRRQVEQARYRAGQAERRYRAVDPDNRLVARGLENRVEHRAASPRRRRGRTRPPRSRPTENPDPTREIGDPGARRRPRRRVVGADHHRQGPQTPAAQPARRSQHQRAPRPHRRPRRAAAALEGRRDHRTDRCRSNAHPPNRLRTDEDTIDLVRRLAVHYPDAMIAHILNRQGRRTARGLSFTAGRVQSLRHHYDIACHQPATTRRKENCSP